MTPQEFAEKAAYVRAARGTTLPWDMTIKRYIMREFPDLTEAEFNNLASVAHQKGLI